mmetsp:Transcript_840/g.2234  ORF Transcript_840/g.2234 Transcript_840/m.2234 type:complete len:231 (+) Transcript_840:1120-1812(+)
MASAACCTAAITTSLSAFSLGATYSRECQSLDTASMTKSLSIMSCLGAYCIALCDCLSASMKISLFHTSFQRSSSAYCTACQSCLTASATTFLVLRSDFGAFRSALQSLAMARAAASATSFSSPMMSDMNSSAFASWLIASITICFSVHSSSASAYCIALQSLTTAASTMPLSACSFSDAYINPSGPKVTAYATISLSCFSAGAACAKELPSSRALRMNSRSPLNSSLAY